MLGLAVFDSQRLEYAIAYMMLLANNDLNLRGTEHDDLVDEYMLNLSKKTLGTLISKLKKLIDINDGFSKRLENALEARNYLTHRFVNDQGENLLTIDGRKKSLQIASEKREILYRCYFFLEPFIQALMKIRGFTPDLFTDEISQKYERE